MFRLQTARIIGRWFPFSCAYSTWLDDQTKLENLWAATWKKTKIGILSLFELNAATWHKAAFG